MRNFVLTGSALFAFAANSVLCRMALGGETIDAVSFATIRLSSGALTLLLIVLASSGWRRIKTEGSWMSSAVLFLYALPFSLAYVSLDAGTGALILFAAVQITMIGVALSGGDRPHQLEWIGLVMALGGLAYLLLPGISAPPLGAASLMVIAGMSWGVYSLRGRNSDSPLADTASNFLRCVPAALAASAILANHISLTSRGTVLAIISGAIASGLGYVIWYAALRGMTATRAATVQLSVPVIAAVGGIVFLAESPTIRLALSSALILSGIGLAIAGSQSDRRIDSA